MQYGVTGAAGFIGSHLCEELRRRGHDVVAFDSFTDFYDPNLKLQNARGFDLRRVDLAKDPIDLDGLDGLFHLAGQPGVRSFGATFPRYLRDNVLASQRVFEAAALARVRVVFASSSSVYGDAETYPTPETAQPNPISPYGITKLACEQLAHAYFRSFGLDCIILRYFTVYGPRQRPDMAFSRLIAALAHGSTFELFGDGQQSRGFTYVSDAVDATVRSMADGYGIYNVGGGTEATMTEVMGMLEEVSGRTLQVSRRERAQGDALRTNSDTARIRSELGWAPETSLRAGLAAQWKWAISQ